MSRLVPAFLILTICTAAASAGEVRVRTYGDGHRVHANAFGVKAPAGLIVDGFNNEVDFFAGPCATSRPSTTVIRGNGARRVIVAPCQ